jgi:cellulose synthase/poly-beta-1,6-N-acetylglucosamine synthase-like glycosyltransferase
LTYTRSYIFENRSSLPNGVVDGSGYIILYGKVYDVTDYLVSASDLMNFSSDIMTRKLVLDRMFLPLNLTMLMLLNLGQDISPYYTGNVTENSDLYIACMDRLFYKGIMQEDMDTGCAKINPALWATMGCILLLFFFKMNLSNLSRLPFMRQFLFSSTDNDSYMINSDKAPYTMLLVPCYAEATDVLKHTIESMAITQYADSRKMLTFVCDGTVKNPRANRETHLEILDILGYSGTEEPSPQAYASLGQGYKKINFAKVYSGFYELGRNRVPYLVIVKVGNPREKNELRRGNRGKRDSMMIALAFLERCMDLANNRMTPLEYQLFNQCYNLLGIDPRMFKYMLVIDADTQLKGTVLQKLVARLENDERLIAISGDVRPANPEENVTTMLQIFPLYMRFFSGLAYEACLGSMITINGGFVMYRIWQDKTPKTVSTQSVKSGKVFYSKQSDDMERTSVPTPWESDDKHTTIMTGVDSNFSLSPPVDVLACCVHPTVLREFATPPADTLHMRNVLLLGEEQYLPIVLLKSHAGHRLGFEPGAIGYATVPNTLRNLQAQQTRLLRTNFHNNIEMLKVAGQIGVSYWILAFTKVLDCVVSPIMMGYLYSVFFRFFVGYGLAYTVIAICFLGLVGLHIFYFLLRRQYKYILWFLLYCLAAVPLFNIWFPVVAVWCSDYADRWYDLWKTDGATHSGRLHGVIDPESENNDKDQDQGIQNDKGIGRGNWKIPRMCLSEFEAAEERRRTEGIAFEDFDAEMLESDFNGFAGQSSPRVSMGSVSSKRYNSINARPVDEMISTPPMAQVRDGLHSVRTVGSSRKYDFSSAAKMKKQAKQPHLRDIFDDLQLLPPSSRRDSDSMVSHEDINLDPFASVMDNPFDDSYAARNHVTTFGDSTTHLITTRSTSKHQPTQSQSSYLSFSSRSTNEPHFVTQSTYADVSTLPSSINSSGFASMPRVNRFVARPDDTPGEYSKSMDDLALNDRSSIRSNFSMAESYVSSNLSLDPEESMATIYSVPKSVLAQHRRQASEPNNGSPDDQEEEELGRRSARHNRLGIRIPTMDEPSTVENRSYSPAPPPLPIISSAASAKSSPSDIEFRESVRKEIAVYLQHADLNRVTRAKVKQHLFNKFGQQVDESQEMQTFVHDSIEQATLDRLTRG